MTNAERIRAMDDKELADWITGLFLLEKPTGLFSEVSDQWLEWLRKEAEK